MPPWLGQHQGEEIGEEIGGHPRIKAALRIPAANRSEALRGDSTEQYSIRINLQWRICFVWNDGDAGVVQIVDYH